MKSAVTPAVTSNGPGTGDWSYLTRSLTTEGFRPLRVEGTIPRELAGTLYRNGPSVFERFGRPYSHAFEADGAVSAVRFSEGRADGASRVLSTRDYCLEEAAGKPLFSSNASWPRRVRSRAKLTQKNVANTSLFQYRDDLFALYETNRPTQIDPDTLDVIAETNIDGVLGRSFSAHPHNVRSRRSIYNFGIEYGLRTALNLYELPAKGAARQLGKVTIGTPVLLHDFIATERYLVFFVSPLKLGIVLYLLGITTVATGFHWAPRDGTQIIVVPIDRPQEVTRFEVEAFFQWHFVGAFEEGDDVVVDVITYKDSSTFHNIPTLEEKGTLERIRVQGRSRKLVREIVSDEHADFPRIDPRRDGARHRLVWMIGLGRDGSELLEVDTESGKSRGFVFAPGQRGSEPVFVPRSRDAREGDGWLISLVHDQRSDLSHWAVFDTTSLPDGPVARAHLEHSVPMTFHGYWVGR